MVMLLSIDVGIRNLAMVLINDQKNIIEWCCDGVPPESDDGLFLSLKKHLDTKPWVTQASLVIIEKQPDRNKKMKSVEHFLHTYFLCKDLQVRLWDARHKIPDVVGPGKKQYAKRKRVSVERCREIIKGTPHEKFFESHAKKDDLADCFMQAISFFGASSSQKPAKEKKKTPRAPTDNQNETKYSRANLAWLYKNNKHHTARFAKDLKRYYSSIDQLIADFQI